MSEQLSKKEIVRSKKVISKLFEKGQFIGTPSLGLLFSTSYEDKKSELQVLFTVPKRKIKKATDRNLLKRRIKEAYRKNKPEIELENNNLIIAIIYQKTYLQPYSFIEDELKSLMQRLKQKLEKKNK